MEILNRTSCGPPMGVGLLLRTQNEARINAASYRWSILNIPCRVHSSVDERTSSRASSCFVVPASSAASRCLSCSRMGRNFDNPKHHFKGLQAPLLNPITLIGKGFKLLGRDARGGVLVEQLL